LSKSIPKKTGQHKLCYYESGVLIRALLKKLENKRNLVTSLLAYRTLVLLNQKIGSSDSGRVRDLELLNFVSK